MSRGHRAVGGLKASAHHEVIERGLVGQRRVFVQELSPSCHLKAPPAEWTKAGMGIALRPRKDTLGSGSILVPQVRRGQKVAAQATMLTLRRCLLRRLAEISTLGFQGSGSKSKMAKSHGDLRLGVGMR